MQHLKAWLALPEETKKNAFAQTATKIGLPAYTVEKDWWVVQTLALLFTMDCKDHLIFKGGTSLSKGWDLIKRFSEDIDLALDREFLGFKGELNKTQIRNLRIKTYEYLSGPFMQELQRKFYETGFQGVTIKLKETNSKDQDPIIEIYTPKFFDGEYLKPEVIVEVGTRSLKEPKTILPICSWVGENFEGRPFADLPFSIPVVNPERTLLEKVFLLHEEFQREPDKIRVNRMSRHLYDIEKLSHTEFAKVALSDVELYQSIISHREKFNKLNYVDYDLHKPESIRFLPPETLLAAWKEDYKVMQVDMFYDSNGSLPFEELMESLRKFQEQINRIVLP